MSVHLYNADCFEIMQDIPDESVDLILCDPPFGITRNTWDKILSFDKMWEQFDRIIKPRGCMAIFSMQPFASKVVMSNPSEFKYEWIWEKTNAVGFLNSHFAPLRAHENILIFSKSAACFVQDEENAMVYNPQFTQGKPYTAISGINSDNYNYKNGKPTKRVSNGERYPRDILTYAKDKGGYHPNQKPVALLEYLIKTYCPPHSPVVLDPTMGSGSTGVAAANCGVDFIGIETSEKYFKIAQERIETAQKG